MGFETGLSGLDANSRYLDSIGNNVANSNVAGFKQSSLSFSDIYANSLSGGSSTGQIGLGTNVASVDQQFGQGSITSTANPLDLAINGNGFFQTSSASTAGSISYTRNGQFQVDRNGYIVNAEGQFLQGYTLPAGSSGVSTTSGLVTATTAPIQLPTTGVSAKATSKSVLEANLNASATIPQVATFDPTNASSYNNVTSMNVFDTLGNPHTISLYFAKNAPNTWNVYATMDNSAATVTPKSAAIAFNSSGVLTTPATKAFSLSLDTSSATASTTPQSISFDLSKLSQYGGQPFGVTSNTQDGYTSGRLTGYNVDTDGTVNGTYSNGQKLILGQVVLQTFRNTDGLVPIGNNRWLESQNSGQPTANTPGTGVAGSLQSSALEQSNVDLTKELVNMIVAQRAYQANAQTIKTEDQILSTLVNLR
jgi:flagellar hook protein FlgE